MINKMRTFERNEQLDRQGQWQKVKGGSKNNYLLDDKK